MTRILRPLSLVAAFLIATSALGACGSGAPAPSGPSRSADPSGSAGPAATNVIANLPDLGLKNVKTETAAARGAVITAAGGTITATGSNGAIYTLAIPRDAMPSTTQIAIYPIGSVDNLPGGVRVSAGVQITPDGIQLQTPATFTIQLPAGTDTKGLGGLLWTGDADKARPYPLSIQGQTVTMHLFHFTDPVVTPDPLAPPLAGGTCATGDDMDGKIGWDLTIPDLGARRNSLTFDLRDCYQNYVAPAMLEASRHLLSNISGSEGGVAYNHWIYALADAASAVGSQDFTVAPEGAQAKSAARNLVKAWYDAENQDCVAHRNDPTADASIAAAWRAMAKGWDRAREWGFDTAANGLDLETALDRLCVQVVIDPSRSYSATSPGTAGTVDVHVGISIAGGPLRPAKAHVTLTRTETGVAAAHGGTDAQGNFSADVDWPDGVDPMQIDVLAELDDAEFIARFDRITKGSGTSIQMTAPTGVWSTRPWPRVLPICQERFMDVDDSKDFTFSLSGPATKTRVDGDHIYFRGTGDGVVAFTASSPTQGAGTYSAYLSVLAGRFRDADGTSIVYVDGHLDEEGALSYDVRLLAGSRLSDFGTNITAKANRLAATDHLGNAIDLTLTGDQLAGTIGGEVVTLQRDCG